MALKVITPGSNTGFDTVGTVDYRAGMIAARTSTGAVVPCGYVTGNPTETAVDNIPIGILGEDRITSGYQKTAQAKELITISNLPASNAYSSAYALSRNNLVSNSIFIETAATTATATLAAINAQESNSTTVDVLVDPSAGTLQFKVAESGPAFAVSSEYTLEVTYTYNLDDKYEREFRGVNYKGAMDDTEGSGKATVWKGFGEYETDQYDTTQDYAIGDALRVTSKDHALGAGVVTKAAGGATVVDTKIGNVTKVPTASDPFLGFTFNPLTV